MASFVTSHSKSLSGSIRVPGDKSISHRSIMLGSIATGTTRVSGFLQGEDSLATLNAFKEMGVSIDRNGSDVIIHGVGMHGLKMPTNSLNLGNSGTSMRLMSGLLSAQSFDSELCGDESLSKRPMERVIRPLRQMGADISGPNSKPPLSIHGGNDLSAIEYTLPVASAQIKSCILLAGLYSKGHTTVIENGISRDHTERMLKGFGYQVQTSPNKISIEGGGSLKACNIEVPSDISSAAFFMVAACISDDAELVLETLVVESPDDFVLVPKGRYAQMRNVYSIPSIKTLKSWLNDANFKNIRVVDVNKTTTEEQRKTPWIGENGASLEDFFDPLDDSLTIEGYPAPTRAIVVCDR